METTNKVKFELKESLTRGEYRQIQREMLKGVDIDAAAASQSMKTDAGSMIDNQEDAVISTIVLSINGSSDNLLDTYNSLSNKDASEILEAANKVFESEQDLKKA